MPTYPNGSIPGDMAGAALDRIHAVLERKLSPSHLSEDELKIYFDLLGQRQGEVESSAFSKELMNEPGNVGYDPAGNLVRTLGGGKMQILKPAQTED